MRKMFYHTSLGTKSDKLTDGARSQLKESITLRLSIEPGAGVADGKDELTVSWIELMAIQ